MRGVKQGLVSQFTNLKCYFSVNFFYLLPKAPDPTLPAVGLDKDVEPLRGEADLGLAQPSELLHLGYQILLSNSKLLLGNISEQLQHTACPSDRLLP